MLAILLAVRGLGAGRSDGWLMVAVGGITPATQITNRWWTRRAGTAG
jgi:hypothetical protein